MSRNLLLVAAGLGACGFALVLAIVLGGCVHPPDPRVGGYLLEAHVCALAAQRLDAGPVEKYAAYDLCEAKAFDRWSADAGAP